MFQSFFVFALVLPVGQLVEEAQAKELSRLQGTWSFVTIEVQGLEVSAREFDGAKLIFDGKKLTLTHIGEDPSFCDFEIRLDKNPKWISMDIKNGTNKGKKSLGIYEIQGSQMKLCVVPPALDERSASLDRPTEFSSRPNATLYHLQKDAKPK